MVGIQREEQLCPRQARHGHKHGLAVFQRALADRQLRRIRVGLDRAGRLPHVQAAKPLGGGLGAGEVRDASRGAGESGHPRRAHRGPHFLAQRRPGRQHVARAAGITIMTGRATGHIPIIPQSRAGICQSHRLEQDGFQLIVAQGDGVALHAA